MSKKKKKKVVMSRLVSLQKADSSFDLAFWKKVGPQGKFEAAWDMVRDLVNWNSKYAPQQRLRRTVSLLKQRSS